MVGDQVYWHVFISSLPEIPNFLSEEECGHMVNLAERERFVTSTAKGGLQSWSEFEIPDIRSKIRASDFKGTEELHLTVFLAKLTVQLQCNLTLLITDASTVHSALLNQK